MHRRFPLAPLLALVLAACSPSNGSEKKGGHPGMGMPPPEVLTTTVAAQSLPLGFEYVGQPAGSREVEAPVSGVASRSLRSEGSLVGGPETLLTTVMQVDPMWVNFGIPDNEQAQLARDVQSGRVALPKDGAFEVALKLADGSIYERTGKLNFSDVRVSPSTGTREARAEVPK